MVECRETVRGRGRDLVTRLNNIMSPTHRHGFRLEADDKDEDTYTVVWEQAGYEDDKDCG